MFLLEGKTWPSFGKKPEVVPEPVSAQTAGPQYEQVDQINMPEPVYLGQSEDYGIKLLSLKNDQMEDGYQTVYAVVHKRHNVIAVHTTTVGSAVKAMQQLQDELDLLLGKNQPKS